MGAEKLWFWRRMLATWLDFLAYSLVFVIFVVLAFGSRDSIRLQGFGITTSHCGPVKLDPSVLAQGRKQMPDVQWNQAALCEVSSFGVARNRFVRLARVDKGTDDVIRSVSVDVAVDDLGRATKPFFLDWIGYLGFLAAILACQTLSPWQATPGMRLLGLRLVADDGGAASLKRAALRLLYAGLLWLTIIAIVFGPVWMIAAYGLTAWLMVPTLLVAGTLSWLVWRPCSVKRSLPLAPLYDLWAGTRIVRTPAPAT